VRPRRLLSTGVARGSGPEPARWATASRWMAVRPPGVAHLSSAWSTRDPGRSTGQHDPALYRPPMRRLPNPISSPHDLRGAERRGPQSVAGRCGTWWPRRSRSSGREPVHMSGLSNRTTRADVPARLLAAFSLLALALAEIGSTACWYSVAEEPTRSGSMAWGRHGRHRPDGGPGRSASLLPGLPSRPRRAGVDAGAEPDALSVKAWRSRDPGRGYRVLGGWPCWRPGSRRGARREVDPQVALRAE